MLRKHFSVVSLLAVSTFAAPAFATPPTASELAEIARVRQHILGAEQLMARRSLLGLTPAQKSNRKRNLARLRAYRLQGVFPKNTHVPGKRVPVFRDTSGTLCAMGYLLAETGQEAAINRVVQTHNLARIRTIARDPALRPALTRWLHEQGMTLAEAARVQPTYESMEQRQNDENRFKRRATFATVGSGLAIWANVAPQRSRTQSAVSGVFGLAMGVYSFRVASQAFSGYTTRTGFLAPNAGTGYFVGAVGVTDMILGLRSLNQALRRQPKQDNAAQTNAGYDTAYNYINDTRLRVSPVLLPCGNRVGGGLMLSKRF